jgi:hypothetical protein
LLILATVFRTKSLNFCILPNDKRDTNWCQLLRRFASFEFIHGAETPEASRAPSTSGGVLPKAASALLTTGFERDVRE